jgi:hypothetical protein
MGKMFLVVVDAHSKWLEVKVVNAAIMIIAQSRDRWSLVMLCL